MRSARLAGLAPPPQPVARRTDGGGWDAFVDSGGGAATEPPGPLPGVVGPCCSVRLPWCKGWLASVSGQHSEPLVHVIPPAILMTLTIGHATEALWLKKNKALCLRGRDLVPGEGVPKEPSGNFRHGALP